VDESDDIEEGLKKGALAPNLIAIFLYNSESVVTTTSLMYFELKP
jgi:hypothetical protein